MKCEKVMTSQKCHKCLDIKTNAINSKAFALIHYVGVELV